MKVQIVDPPAYTPPYDRSLCAALARSGADVELVTSRFSHGPVPPAEGYRVSEVFYRRSGGRSGGGSARRALKAAEHLGDMMRYRRDGRAADVVHYQWLPLPALDSRLLPPTRPRVLTAHGVLREEGFKRRLARGLRSLLERMDAVVTLSEHGARRLRDQAGFDERRVRVIPHGALDYLTRLPDEAPLPEELAAVEGPVVLCFGLIRPYKGVDVLLDAFRSIDGAELWIVGRPLGISLDGLRKLAAPARGRVRFVPRFVQDRELPAYFRRADMVALPHRDAEQSGVLFAALAFGKAIVMSDVGGFAEVAAHGAGRLVPPGDPAALASAIEDLLADPAARERLAESARDAAAGPYSWEAVAEQTLALYRELLGVIFLAIAFWVSVGLLVYTHLGYPALLWALARARGRAEAGPRAGEPPPSVSLIIAAHDEEAVIEAKVREAGELDYPRDLLQVIVASDGSADRTVELAQEAGADVVLDLPRGGKVAALNAAVPRSSGEILAFSDANSFWEPDALRRLVARLADPAVGYVCGQVRFDGTSSANEEGLYWRYEMAVRELESSLGGVTAGNGAINAIRREAYLFLEPTRGQDISFPFELRKRGWRSVYEPGALARERLADSISGEFGRKRRMMAGAWSTMLRHGLLSVRGYSPLYALEVFSHRLLRYASPLLHLVALATNITLLGQGTVYAVTLGCQLALLAAAGLGAVLPLRPLRIAHYYVAVTAASAVGLWDYLRRGVPRTWEKAEGTR